MIGAHVHMIECIHVPFGARKRSKARYQMSVFEGSMQVW